MDNIIDFWKYHNDPESIEGIFLCLEDLKECMKRIQKENFSNFTSSKDELLFQIETLSEVFLDFLIQWNIELPETDYENIIIFLEQSAGVDECSDIEQKVYWDKDEKDFYKYCCYILQDALFQYEKRNFQQWVDIINTYLKGFKLIRKLRCIYSITQYKWLKKRQIMKIVNKYNYTIIS